MSPAAIRPRVMAVHSALAPVHCRHPSRQLPASSLTFPDCPVPCLPQGLYTGWARCLLLGNRPTRCPSMSSQEALPHCSVCHLLCVWDQNVLPSMCVLSLTIAATPQQQRPVYRRCPSKACEIKERESKSISSPMDPGPALELGTKRSPCDREHLSAPHTCLIPSLVNTTTSTSGWPRVPGAGGGGWGLVTDWVRCLQLDAPPVLGDSQGREVKQLHRGN